MPADVNDDIHDTDSSSAVCGLIGDPGAVPADVNDDMRDTDFSSAVCGLIGDPGAVHVVDVNDDMRDTASGRAVCGRMGTSGDPGGVASDSERGNFGGGDMGTCGTCKQSSPASVISSPLVGVKSWSLFDLECESAEVPSSVSDGPRPAGPLEA